METFSINLSNGKTVKVKRDEEYEVTYHPISDDDGKDITNTGVVRGLSINLHFLRVEKKDSGIIEIPIRKIVSIKEKTSNRNA